MKLDLADVKPGLWSLLVVGTMALIFIVGGKYVFTRWHVPGLSELFASA